MNHFSVKGKKPRAWVWISSDGREVHLKKMTDDHLKSVIRMLRRLAKKETDRCNTLEVQNTPSDEYPYLLEEEQVLQSIATWPNLLHELSLRDLEELPWEERKVPVEVVDARRGW